MIKYKASVLPHFKRSTSSDILFRIDDKVSLHIFEFDPVGPSKSITIVMITGLVTMIDSFHTIIEGLAESHRIIYIETRDKTSSEIVGSVDWSISAMASDVNAVIKARIPEGSSYALLGFSMGGPVIAESFGILAHKPSCLIFMEPTAEFNYPRWSLFFIRRMRPPSKKLNAFIAKSYLRMTLMNASEDRAMMDISFNSIDNSEPSKIRNTILAISGYRIYDSLDAINCPCLVIGTSKDKFHSREGMDRMLGLLENAIYADLETNARTHSMEMVRVTDDFIRGITERSAGK